VAHADVATSLMNSSGPIWVVGGEQRGVPHFAREWKLYRKALVLKAEAGSVERVFEYESPPEYCPDDSPSIVFKAATIKGNRVYLCTQTEILICEFPSFVVQKIISLPCFNDVHHVAVASDGRLFVAVTGLDAVAELAPDGALLRLVSVVGGSVWDRFSPTVDYRKVPTTKPHRAHPNFVFFLDGRPWVTRFEQRDAVPLDGEQNGREIFRLGDEPVHDGYVAGSHVYFTTVDGYIIRFDLASGEKQSFALPAMRGSYRDRPLGWCRGILPMGQRVWVGFSRVRFTALRHNLDWVRRGFRQIERLPPSSTRIACYDLTNARLVEEIDLEHQGMNTIFSIHTAERALSGAESNIRNLASVNGC
jgi:hypothetical protein